MRRRRALSSEYQISGEDSICFFKTVLFFEKVTYEVVVSWVRRRLE